MAFAALPARAAWRHVAASEGFEVVWIAPTSAGGHTFTGHSVAVGEGAAWAVRYAIEVDAGWATRRAEVWSRTDAGEELVVRLDARGGGRWRVDGRPAPSLDGCLDVDLEASACTNTLPVHRLALRAGAGADAPAVYVRAAGLAVERLAQTYHRVADDGPRSRFDYAAPRFSYADRLVYDEAGLVLDYPGLAVRVG